MCVCVCVCVCVCCFVGADGCIPLTMLVDACQCCRLLVFICLLLFETLSSLSNLENKEPESEAEEKKKMTTSENLPCVSIFSWPGPLPTAPTTKQNDVVIPVNTVHSPCSLLLLIAFI